MATAMDITEFQPLSASSAAAAAAQLRERVRELEQRLELMQARQDQLERRLFRLEGSAGDGPIAVQGEEAAERMRAKLNAARLDLIRVLDLPNRSQKERVDLAQRILSWASANNYVSVIAYIARLSFPEIPVGGGGGTGAQPDTPPRLQDEPSRRRSLHDPPLPPSIWDLNAIANMFGNESGGAGDQPARSKLVIPQGQSSASAGAAASGDGSGSTGSRQWALHNAAAQGDADAVARLLDSGSDSAACDGEGRTPLHRAAAGGHARAVNALLLAGAEVNARDKCLRTPLHVAAGVGLTNPAELLIRAGADPNARDKSERTPLHRAAGCNHFDMVKMLLEVGAKPDMRDRSNALPISLSNHPEVRNLLASYQYTLPAESN